MTRESLHHIVAVETLSAILHMVHRALNKTKESGPIVQGPPPVMVLATHSLAQTTDPTLSLLSLYELNRRTTIPLPTHKNWRDAVLKDKDLTVLKEALDHKATPTKESLQDRRYW